MRLVKLYNFLVLILVAGLCACKHKADKSAKHNDVIYKGTYALGPEAKTFKECNTAHEYWVADSSAELELKYWEIVMHETPETPVYIEVQGDLTKSNLNDNGGHTEFGGYAQTLTVRKVIKITKDIPADCK